MQLPSPHRRLLDDLLAQLCSDERIVGVAVAGSIASGTADEYSDVDLVIVVDDAVYSEVMDNRVELVRGWAPVVAAFTGEHVGEPRVVIALVDPPLLHVDFKFVRQSDFADRVADPLVLHDPQNLLRKAIASTPAPRPGLDLQWIEDRFWVWIHYGATKLARGELFELIGFLAAIREMVLGPIAAVRAHAGPRGVRHLETLTPHDARALQGTLAGYDRRDAARALRTCADLYRRWTHPMTVDIERRTRAEECAMQYLQRQVDAIDRDGSAGHVDP